MLIISWKSKELLPQVHDAMARELRIEAFKNKIEGEDLSAKHEAVEARIKKVWKGFESQIAYLATYGTDPRRWRVFLTISSQPHDWNYHSVTFWHYPENGPVHPQTGLPTDENLWTHFMTGALVYHSHDDSWSIHT